MCDNRMDQDRERWAGTSAQGSLDTTHLHVFKISYSHLRQVGAVYVDELFPTDEVFSKTLLSMQAHLLNMYYDLSCHTQKAEKDTHNQNQLQSPLSGTSLLEAREHVRIEKGTEACDFKHVAFISTLY